MRSESDHTLVTVTFSRGTLLLMSPSIAPCARTLYLVAHPRFQSYQDAVTYTELAYEDVPPSVMYPALHHAPGPLSDWIRFQRSRTEESTLPGDPQRFANLVLTNLSCLRELEDCITFLACTHPDLGADDFPDTLETLAIANPPPPTLSYLDYDATRRNATVFRRKATTVSVRVVVRHCQLATWGHHRQRGTQLGRPAYPTLWSVVLWPTDGQKTTFSSCTTRSSRQVSAGLTQRLSCSMR